MKQQYPLSELTEAFGVGKSGWHAHRRKAQRPRAAEDRELLNLIEPVFADSRQTYGSPRVTEVLRQSGQRCGKNRVARLMRQRGLKARQKRRFRPQTTQSRHDQPVAPNWVAKVPAPDRPDQVWVADITYVETEQGWLYVAGIVDACSRRCIGWARMSALELPVVGHRQVQKFVNDAIRVRVHHRPEPFYPGGGFGGGHAGKNFAD